MNPTPESQGEFQRLVSAFETLSDPQKRQQWEQKKATTAWRPGTWPTTARAHTAKGTTLSVGGGCLRTWSYSNQLLERVQVVAR